MIHNLLVIFAAYQQRACDAQQGTAGCQHSLKAHQLEVMVAAGKPERAKDCKDSEADAKNGYFRVVDLRVIAHSQPGSGSCDPLPQPPRCPDYRNDLLIALSRRKLKENYAHSFIFRRTETVMPSPALDTRVRKAHAAYSSPCI